MVRGRIVAAETGAALHRAYVKLKPRQGEEVGAITDEQGRFEFAMLPAAMYTMRVSKGGRVTRLLGQGPEDADGRELEVSEGQVITDVAVSLPPGAVIAGRFVDEAGQPMARVRVAALAKRFGSGAMELADNWAWPEDYGDLTDDRGRYRIIGLPAGTYYIGGSSEARLDSYVGNNPLRDRDFPPSYFPGTYNPRAATAMTVREGEERTADFALSGSLPRVSGQVVGADGKPAINAVVKLSDKDSLMPSADLGVLRVSDARESGRFELTNVPPGQYQVTAQIDGPVRAAHRLAKMDVSVGGTDITDLRLVLAPGGRATGRIVSEDGTPFSTLPQGLFVYFARATPIQYRVVASPPVSLKADGSFTVENLFDLQYLRATTVTMSWCLKRVLRDGRDIIDQPIAFTPFADISGLTVEVTRKCSSLSGMVSDASGRPAEQMQLLVYPRDPKLWVNESRFVRYGSTDAQGRYRVPILPANTEYLVIAAPLVGATYNQDPAYWHKITPLATAVMLGENETRVQDLTVARLPR